MVTRIPEHPDFTNSSAERTVWDSLCAQLPDDATLIHGQRIVDKQGRDVEIDILVLWPGQGAVVIEVKGGRVGIEEGVWHSISSGGHRNRLKQSPLEQAMTAKHALVSYLKDHCSSIRFPIVHMAVFPYTELPADWTVPDAPRTSIADSTQLTRLADALVGALRAPDLPAHLDPLAPMEHAVKALRGTYYARENVRIRAQEIADSANAYTREQEKLIRVLRHQRRAEISGGAGSGKTHLALIKARELTRAGLKVALMCYSRGLGRYLQLTTDAWPADERPAYVGLFHDLPVSWGAEPGSDDDPDYWERRLPAELKLLADDRRRTELFDAIVIDEGQDFSQLWWEAVQSCLRNQVEGILYVFTDDLQRIFDRYGDAPITMSPFQLDENLRNSQQIAEAFGYLADEAPLIRNGPGEAVEYVDVPGEIVEVPGREGEGPSGVTTFVAEDALGAADDVVEHLLDSGWQKGDIALLTTYTRHPVQREIVDSEGYDAYWDQFFAAEDLFYGHVLGFKGLERPVVVLCVNGFRDLARAREMLYVGMSRATAKLVVVGPQDLLARIADPEWDPEARQAPPN